MKYNKERKIYEITYEDTDSNKNNNEYILKTMKIWQIVSENVYKKLQEVASKISELEEIEKYVSIAESTEWPIYFGIRYEEFYKKIIKQYEAKQEIEEYIFGYYKKVVINNMLKRWEESKIINPLRIPILKEAIKMYENNNYYSCTSIMMCQLYGISEDICNFLDNNNFEKSIQIQQFIKSEGIKKINSEKSNLYIMILSMNKNIGLWARIYKYFKNFLLSSENVYINKQENPMRNKICHGEQLNFGTKKCSLKSILCIDILFELANNVESFESL